MKKYILRQQSTRSCVTAPSFCSRFRGLSIRTSSSLALHSDRRFTSWGVFTLCTTTHSITTSHSPLSRSVFSMSHRSRIFGCRGEGAVSAVLAITLRCLRCELYCAQSFQDGRFCPPRGG